MFFDRHASGERALLVHILGLEETNREDLFEFKELAKSAGAHVVHVISIKVSEIQPRSFIKKGQIQNICDILLNDTTIDLILFNGSLSSSQERNLEKQFNIRVVDRIGLILDIFAQRARTYEGKLQVELAQLEHLSTRLIRGWTHLERQKGGIGLRGPGETQLESDRRMLRARIKNLHKKMDKIKEQRFQTRKYRKKSGVIQISLVGYTNAGKSTLFNTLTSSSVHAEDQVFATLDPTIRQFTLPDIGNAILVDTVGFIRHLPHQLVKAFRATFEESAAADTLLHIVDCTSKEREDNIEQVNMVLEQIGLSHLPTLLVFNKIDLCEGVKPHTDYDEHGNPWRIWISSLNDDESQTLLLEALVQRLNIRIIHQHITLSPNQGALRSQLYTIGAVYSERIDDQGNFLLEIRTSQDKFNRILKNKPDLIC